MIDENDEKNEQTAVVEETNEEPKEATPAEGDAAQGDGLDELLKEFDERREATQPREESTRASESKTEPQIDTTALAVLEKRIQDQEARETRRELERLFDRFTSGVQADAIDAEAFLNSMALRDPRINQAYLNRANSPKAWDKVEGALRQEFQKRYGKKVDKQVTESRDAVASAVRSASTAAPRTELTDKEILDMPLDEWHNLQRKLGITPL